MAGCSRPDCGRSKGTGAVGGIAKGMRRGRARHGRARIMRMNCAMHLPLSTDGVRTTTADMISADRGTSQAIPLCMNGLPGAGRVQL